MNIRLEDLRVQDDVNLDGMEVKDDVELNIGEVGISPERVPEKGDDGLSAYEIALKNGFVGTEEEWLESLKGEQGIPGEQGVPGENGEDGNGIVSIEKTGTSGYVDTYTILFANGTSTTFTVKNGANGTNGENGKTPIFKSENNKLYVSYNDGGQWTYLQDIQEGTNGTDGKDGEDGKTPTFKVVNNILYVSYDNGLSWVGLGNIGGKDGKDGVDGKDGQDGSKGENGVGISKMEKTSTKGNIDTYTITLTNKQTYSFTVTNGNDGKDAVSPQIRINAMTNEWEVSTNNGVTWTSLGVKATGENGKDGNDGKDGNPGKDGVDGKDGANGKDGNDGKDGKSAYEIWLELGNVGTEEDFIEYLKANIDESSFAKVSQSNDFSLVQTFSGDMPTANTANVNTVVIGKSFYVMGAKNASGGWLAYSLCYAGKLDIVGNTNNRILLNTTGATPTISAKDATNGSRTFSFPTQKGTLATEESVDTKLANLPTGGGTQLYKHLIYVSKDNIKAIGEAGYFEIISSRAEPFTKLVDALVALGVNGSYLDGRVPYMLSDTNIAGTITLVTSGPVISDGSGGYYGNPTMKWEGVYVNGGTVTAISVENGFASTDCIDASVTDTVTVL